MSYLIHIGNFPVPESNDQAWKQLEECLSAPDRMASQAPILLQFIDQITKTYPCICDLDEENEDEGVWSDGPIRNNIGSREVTLGIVGDAEEVMSFLVPLANSMGLTVFDPQNGQIDRPEL